MQSASLFRPVQAELDSYRLTFSRTAIPGIVIEILQNCPVRKHRDGFSLNVPQMPEQEYKIFKQVVGTLKGCWKRPVHQFPYDPTPLLAQVVEAGYVPHANPFDLFETPDETIDDLFSMVDLPIEEDNDEPIVLDLLEPSAGSGRIARKLRERLPHSQIDVAEIDPFNRCLLEMQGFNVICQDWLKDAVVDPNQRYDYILTNPPFNRGDYVKHIRQDFKLLKPHGKIAAVVPEEMLRTSSRQVRAFRDWVAEFGNWESIGSVFANTKTRCLILEIQNLAPSYVSELWQPVNGYASRFQESAQILLDCSQAWHNVLSRARTMPDYKLNQFFSQSLDDVIETMIQKEYECLLYDKRVKQQLIEYAMTTYKEG